jgi:hypothetical protein
MWFLMDNVRLVTIAAVPAARRIFRRQDLLMHRGHPLSADC